MVENKPPRPGFYLDHAVLDLERLEPDGLEALVAWPQIQDGGVLINNFSLGTLAKVALRLGEEKNDHGRFPSHQDLGDALLAANDQATVRMDVALIGYSAPVH